MQISSRYTPLMNFEQFPWQLKISTSLTPIENLFLSLVLIGDIVKSHIFIRILNFRALTSRIQNDLLVINDLDSLFRAIFSAIEGSNPHSHLYIISFGHTS